MIGKSKQILLYRKEDNGEIISVDYYPLTGKVNISSYYHNQEKSAIRYSKNKDEINAKRALYRIKNKSEIKSQTDKLQMLLDDIKIGFGCAICGFDEYPESLDLHHVVPKDKKYQIDCYKLLRKDFIKEIQKCICLCANCHRHITRIERKKIRDDVQCSANKTAILE